MSKKRGDKEIDNNKRKAIKPKNSNKIKKMTIKRVLHAKLESKRA